MSIHEIDPNPSHRVQKILLDSGIKYTVEAADADLDGNPRQYINVDGGFFIAYMKQSVAEFYMGYNTLGAPFYTVNFADLMTEPATQIRWLCSCALSLQQYYDHVVAALEKVYEKSVYTLKVTKGALRETYVEFYLPEHVGGRRAGGIVLSAQVDFTRNKQPYVQMEWLADPHRKGFCRATVNANTTLDLLENERFKSFIEGNGYDILDQGYVVESIATKEEIAEEGRLNRRLYVVRPFELDRMIATTHKAIAVRFETVKYTVMLQDDPFNLSRQLPVQDGMIEHGFYLFDMGTSE